jgi:hypothetical protein
LALQELAGAKARGGTGGGTERFTTPRDAIQRCKTKHAYNMGNLLIFIEALGQTRKHAMMRCSLARSIKKKDQR